MSVTSPEEMHRAFAEAFNKGDVDALLALYEDEAALVPQPQAEARVGKSQLREALQPFLALNGRITLTIKAIIQTGDLALNVSQWSLSGTDPDGNPVQMGGTTGEVLRRQADGSWLYVIDNPWGDAIATG
jgi:ketosteroid isomerase-like protein